MTHTDRTTARRRSPRAGAASAAALALLTSLVTGGVTPASAAAASSNGYMVTFGDSVPAGSHCGCTPFPDRYARKVGVRLGRSVTMTSYAFGGAVASDVMDQLSTARVQRAVRRSGTALIMVGANDFAGAFSDVLAHRRRAADAFPPVADRVQRRVTAEVRQIQQLSPGIHVIVLGYWNVMKDGAVGLRTYGTWGEAKAVRATLDADAGLHEAAVATHSTYVSTYYPFKGWDGSSDPTPLLAADGDHPNAVGHGVIARAVYRAAPDG